MKFDNTNITKAIECFNKAYDAQKDLHKHGIDYRVLLNNRDYQEGVDCLNKQFDARLNIRYIKTSDGTHGNLYTSVYNDLKPNIHISKSKGFQLGGMAIEIFVWDRMLEQLSPNNPELFGQRITSYFCHEIFHNIAKAMRQENAQSYSMLTATMSIASGMKSPRNRRIMITNYVNTLEKMPDAKKLSKLQKLMLVQELCTMAAFQSDVEAINKLHIDFSSDKKMTTDEYVDKLIKKYKRYINRKTGKLKRGIGSGIGAIGAAVIATMFPATSTAYMISSIGALMLGLHSASSLYGHVAHKASVKHFESTSHMEEHYCDLFAGMYQLPVTFFVGMPKQRNQKITPNQVKDDKLKELAKLEVQMHREMMDVHPSDIERTHAGVRIAKNLLNSGEKLDPNVKKYCQWIADNFSSAENVNIEEIYNKNTFSPKEAENLDQYLEKLIKDNDVTITEWKVI